MYKPQVPYEPQIYKNFQTRFGGYNHTSSCGEGEIYDMKNIGHEEFPVLTPRRGRNTAPAFDNGRSFPAYSETEIIRPKIKGIYAFDEAYVIEQAYVMKPDLAETETYALHLCRKGMGENEAQNIGNMYNVIANEDEITSDYGAINRYVSSKLGDVFRKDVKYFLPYGKDFPADPASYLNGLVDDGKISVKENDVVAVASSSSNVNGAARFPFTNYTCFRRTKISWEKLRNEHKVNESVTGKYAFKDGTYKGEEAEANTIEVTEEGDMLFGSAGDGIIISGCTEQPLNNKAAVIKEITGELAGQPTKFGFYENTFTLVNDAEVIEPSVTISRVMPELDFMCHCNNRLFGCKGDTIYASKLGDPYNWNVFEGISTDSYSVEVGSVGDFTACFAYGGDVLFFKEERIYKLLYTDTSPENWRLVETEAYGVKAGCDKSLAIADSCLFYYSPKGVMRYAGSVPMSINAAFGVQEFENAVAGSDGKDYYICLTDKAGVSELYVFDTVNYLWFKHDAIKIIDFAYYKGELTALVESENGDTEVIRIGQKNAEVPIANEWFDMKSMVEFGDATNNTINKKNETNLSVLAEVAAKSELTFYISADGKPYEYLGSIKGPSKKQVTKFSFVPARCDYYRIKVEGKGLWKIYARSNGYFYGSDI